MSEGPPTNPGYGPHGGYRYGQGAPTPPPPPGAPAGPSGPQQPSTRGRTNPLAIASLACSVLGFFVCVTAPIGIVLGVIAQRQIKENGEQGHGLALAGVITGVVATAFAVLTTLVFFVLVITTV